MKSKGDSPTVERSAAEVCSGIFVEKVTAAKFSEAPVQRIKVKSRRKIHPELGPKPCLMQRYILTGAIWP